MKVVILAGGLGTRLAEETEVRPKPMVEIGGRPILWHIMQHYAHYGCKEFYIALGYKGEVIKRYFLDYYSLHGSMTIDLSSGKVARHRKACEELRHQVDYELYLPWLDLRAEAETALAQAGELLRRCRTVVSGRR